MRPCEDSPQKRLSIELLWFNEPRRPCGDSGELEQARVSVTSLNVQADYLLNSCYCTCRRQCSRDSVGALGAPRSWSWSWHVPCAEQR
jgi:hypothetical protein